MIHIKGKRFDFPLIRRLGVLKHLGTYTVKWNRHPGLEIHYVLKGDIGWELQGTDRPLTVPGGYFALIPAGTSHRALGDNGTPAIRLGVIFETAVESFRAGTPFSREDLRRIFRRFGENGGRVRRLSPRLSAVIRELTDALSIETVLNPDGQLRLRTLAGQLVYETYATLGEPEALADGHDVVPKICRWIESHCHERISTDRLVKLSGYGRSRFFTLFLSATGMTPNDYLVRTRIEHAKRELAKRTHAKSILDIATACGFNSAAVFSTTFRKHVGLSPREFRQG